MTAAYAAPGTLDELDRLLSGPLPCWLIAGGTDRLIAPAALPQDGLIVDLTHVAGFDAIVPRQEALLLGAGVTVARLAQDPNVARLAPVLAQAADDFGSVQIRNRATLAGNVANGSAAADLTPALLAAGARLRLRHAGRECCLPLERWLARVEGLRPGEVMTGFELPLSPGPQRGAFVKLGPRREPAISRLTLAAAGPPGALRLYAGAVGPVPRRMIEAEACLNAGGAGLAAALEQAIAAANPGRPSTGWKSRSVRALAEDLCASLDLQQDTSS